MAAQFKYLWKKFMTLNLFETDENDEDSIRKQRISTRFYIILLTLAVFILLLISSLRVETHTIEIDNPSYSTYIKLSTLDESNTLKCPCSVISSTYGDFVQMTPSYHPVCSSYLVSMDWINFLYDMIKTQTLYSLAFQKTASYDFQVLKELCQSTQSIVNDSLRTFYSTQLISGQLLNKDVLNAQVNAIRNDFQSNLFQLLHRPLSLIRTFTSSDGLISAGNTAFVIGIFFYDGNIIWGTSDQWYTESDQNICLCEALASCHLIAEQNDYTKPLSQTYEQGNDTQLIPNWYVACWPLESVILSSLAIFYNQSILKTIINTTFSSNFQISNSSNFNISTNIDELINNMFIEEWIVNISYLSYFNHCKPRTCFYQINQHQNALNLFTTLIGLAGGLSVALRLIVTLIIKYVFKFIRYQQNKQPSTNVPTIETQVRRWMIVTFILEFNLFKTAKYTQPNDLKQQRWSTRLFIVLLFITLIILTVYIGIRQQTKTIDIEKPSFKNVQDLQQNTFISISLQCPCSQISSTYENFLNLIPEYHQICTSVYVTSEWLHVMEVALKNFTTIIIYYADFRGYLQFFITLQSLCTLANTTVSNSLRDLDDSQLVTAYFLTRQAFESQMNLTIENFKQSTMNDYLGLMHLLLNISHANQYLSGDSGNFDIQWSLNSTDSNNTLYPILLPGIYFNIHNRTETNICSCLTEISCKVPVGIYSLDLNDELIYGIPGMYIGCSSILSLYVSTLECFYDNSNCLIDIDRLLETNFYSRFSRLNSRLSSKFQQNSTMNILIENLFMESWIMNTSYENYFNSCAIQSCSYTIYEHKNIIEIIITLIGFVGGISTALLFVVPWIIRIIYLIIERYHPQYRQQRQQQQLTNQINQQLSVRIKSLCQYCIHLIRNINIFSNPNKAIEDEQNLRLQYLSTRIYIVLLVLALTIVSFYSSLTYATNIIEIDISTINDYVKLRNQYNRYRSVSKFECPCQTLSTPYSSYIHQLEPQFHVVCSSDIVSHEWIQILFENYITLNFFVIDSYTFKGTMFGYYQALNILCNLVKEAVNDARTLFLNSIIINSQIVDQNQFEQNIMNDIEQFQQTLPNNFLSMLKLVRGLNQANALVSSFASNWHLLPIVNVSEEPTLVSYDAQYYEQCNCATTATCHQLVDASIPGYMTGCVPIESLLQSTLECYYNLSCMQLLFSYVIENTTAREFTSLNDTQTRFARNATVAMLIEEMFIESWSSNISYNDFFYQCKPSKCSITLIEQFNFLYVSTIITSLFGGFSMVFRLISPLMARFIYRFILKRRTRILPIPSAEIQNSK